MSVLLLALLLCPLFSPRVFSPPLLLFLVSELSGSWSVCGGPWVCLRTDRGCGALPAAATNRAPSRTSASTSSQNCACGSAPRPRLPLIWVPYTYPPATYAATTPRIKHTTDQPHCGWYKNAEQPAPLSCNGRKLWPGLQMRQFSLGRAGVSVWSKHWHPISSHLAWQVGRESAPR